MMRDTLRLLEEFEGIAAKGLEQEIDNFHRMIEVSKSAEEKKELRRKIKSLNKLHHQIVWGV